MDIGKIIRDARKAKGWTLDELSSQIETDSGNLSRLERGKQFASKELLNKIMAVLELELVPAYDMAGVSNDTAPRPAAKGRQEAHGNVEISGTVFSRPKLYPLIDPDKVKAWAESPGNLKPDDTHMYLESTEDAGERGFWMVVKGDYMACNGNPSFPDGSYILVKPESEPISGKYYVVMLENGEQTFKQLVMDAGHKYLRPLNENYRTIEIGDTCQFIGRVIDTNMTGL